MSQSHLDVRAHLRDQPSYRLLWALWGGLAVIDVGHLLRATPLQIITGVAVLVAACCVRAGLWTALGIAGVAWALVNGFVVNSLGQLHLVGYGDAVRAGVLVAAAVAGTRLLRTQASR